MKNLKKFYFIVILSLFFSCEDNLDIIQPGELNQDSVTGSLTTFQQALNGVYGTFPYTNTVGFVSVWTDEVKIGLTNGGQGIGDGSYGYVLNDQSGDASSIWVSHHRIVNLANRIIEGAPDVPISNVSEQNQVKNIVAQARFLRALAYIQVLPFFTTDLSNDNALGVIAFTDVPSISDKRPRSTNGEIYNLINQDLNYAESNLITPTAPFPTGFSPDIIANLRACKAIRARMAIYRKDYSNALILANDLISQVPLSPRAQYVAMWTDTNNNERIFTFRKTVADGTFAGLWSNVAPATGANNWYEMGRSLFEKLNVTGDIRRNAFVGPTSTISSNPATDPNYRVNDQLIIFKYPGKLSRPYLADFKIFRVSEMHLIKAEAEIGLNQLNNAAQTLKTFRDFRFSSPQILPTYSSPQQAYQDLLLERRKEMCYEGHRYIDIKRLGQVANVTFERYFRDCAINNSCTPLPINDYRLTMPIPAVERNANPNAVQNPNY